MANADREMVDGLRVRTDVNAPGLGNPAGGPQNAARRAPRREASRVRERDASAGQLTPGNAARISGVLKPSSIIKKMTLRIVTAAGTPDCVKV